MPKLVDNQDAILKRSKESALDNRYESKKSNDIAVIGMSCRLPGAKNYYEFWKNIIGQVNSVTEIPSDRWDWKEYFGDPHKEERKSNSKWGGFIEDIDAFDPLFFEISPKEANYIDPQHRIFLEEVWKTIEDAGYKASALSGKKIGVYAGVSKNDYAELMEGMETASFVSTGTVHSILTNRVSYLLNLRGKSESVDTACSSALVALNNAIRDIKDGECEAALVGGVNALLSPRMYLSHGKSGMLSSKGRCSTFDEEADGYVRSEGVAVVFIKALDRAIADGDNVIGVIKSTAINHGGKGNFLTAPNVNAQSEVICDAMRKAAIDPRSIGYIETHGTGTPVGDPIEINALKKAYKTLFSEMDLTPEIGYCGLGAVKGNIGHLESAAGMASLIKCLLALKYKKLVPVLHLKKLNPYIELDNSPFQILKDPEDWPENVVDQVNLKRRAGISAFGMGGVNAHVILEEAPTSESIVFAESKQDDQLILISAKKGGLKKYAQEYVHFLNRPESDLPPLESLAFTLLKGREVYQERLAIKASSISMLRDELQKFIDDIDSTHVHYALIEEKKIKKASESILCQNQSELLEAWISGKSFDTAEGLFTPTITQLPTYPFIKRKCWFRERIQLQTTTENQEKEKLGPRAFRKEIKPSSSILQDHKVQSVKTLPGVGYLSLLQEFLRTEIILKEPRYWRFNDVFWLSPITFFESSHTVEIGILEEGGFSVKTAMGNHCQGFFSWETNTVLQGDIPLNSIYGNCTFEVNNVYDLFAGHGLKYGKTFQGIGTFNWNKNEAIVKLTAYDSSRKWWNDPGIMDLAFQSAAALSILNETANDSQCVPYYVKEVIFDTDASKLAYVHVRQGEKSLKSTLKFEITLMDENGKSIGQFNQFSKRILHDIKPAILKQDSEMFYYKSDWIKASTDDKKEEDSGIALLINFNEKTTRNGFEHPQYFSLPEDEAFSDQTQIKKKFKKLFDELKSDETKLAYILYNSPHAGEKKANDLIVLFQMIQALIESKHRQPTKILYVNTKASSVELPYIAAVGGFSRTLLFESPRLNLAVVTTDEKIEDCFNQIVLECKNGNSPLQEVRFENQSRLVRSILTIDSAMTDPTPPFELKKDGVYIIIGGSGGLGKIFAKAIAKSQSTKIVLVGRREKDQKIKSFLEELAELGSQASYASLDVTNAEDVVVFMENIRERGDIKGIIHAGGLIEDAFILRKELNSFNRVIAPKIVGTVNLDVASASDKLDFFLCFSSIAALMPNQGQCDYAAGNSFIDSFVVERKLKVTNGERYGVSLAINWPLWKDGGMKVLAQEEEHLWQYFGMKPLTTSLGEKILFTSLTLSDELGVSEILVIDGDKDKIDKNLKVSKSLIERNVAVIPVAHSQKSIREVVIGDIKAIVAQAFITPVDELSVNESLRDLGIDSVVLLVVTELINAFFDANLKPTIFYELNTIDELANYLLEEKRDCVDLSYSKFGRILSMNRSSGLIDLEKSKIKSGIFVRKYTNKEFYMVDHVVEGMYNVPGACFIEMARQAGAYSKPKQVVVSLQNNYWAKQLSSSGEPFNCMIQLKDLEDRSRYEIYSLDDEGKRSVHASGELIYENEMALFHQEEEKVDLERIKNACTKRVSREDVYAQIHAEGLHVGSSFMPMLEIFVSEDQALACIELPNEIKSTWSDYLLHPTMLTGVFQTALINNRYNGDDDLEFIPMAIEGLDLKGIIPTKCFVHSHLKKNESKFDFKKFDISIYDEEGVVLMRLRNFIIKAKPSSLKKSKEKHPEKTSSRLLTDEEETSHVVSELLKGLVAPIIGLNAEELDENTVFETYGINSVMILELNKALEEEFGSGLSKTLFFEYETLSELTTHFLEEYDEVLEEKLKEKNRHSFVASDTTSREKTLIKQEGPVVLSESPVSINKSQSSSTIKLLKELLAPSFGLVEDELDEKTAFDEYGINSVMILELNKIFEDKFGSGLSKTLFFEYQTVSELTDYFEEEYTDLIRELSPEIGSAALPEDPARPQETLSAPIAEQVGIQTEKEEPSIQKNDKLGVESGDIAIIGVAGRYPMANSLGEFWENLKSGKDCVTPIPKGLFSHDNSDIYCHQGGFLDDVDKFDAPFFNISGEEASLTDPQERLFLQIAYQAFEDAGYTKSLLEEELDGEVGVYVGAIWQNFSHLASEQNSSKVPTSLLYSIANRVSYYMNLKGNSMAVDTACSSSLTALHLACQSLLTNDNQMAVAGGVNLSLSSSKYLWLCENNFLSSDGKCRSFGEGGDGYVPGEGVGAVILKRLEKAIEDKDQIYGVIRGISVNHGGKTNGYTVPSPKAQKNLIAKTLEKAKIDPSSISYVEAHGTGTDLGDTVEISGLVQAFKSEKSTEQDCAIGSVKSNIGHLEAASGIAELTKVLLQMKHGQLVPSLHSETPNTNIDFASIPFKLQHELELWKPVNGFPRRAAISSFGAGGTNAHMIVDEYMAVNSEDSGLVKQFHLATISAKTVESLRQRIVELQTWLAGENDLPDIADLCFTLNARREHFGLRCAFIIYSLDDFSNKLAMVAVDFDKELNDYAFGEISSIKEDKSILEAAHQNAVNQLKLGTTGKGREYKNLLELLSKLYISGLTLDWKSLHLNESCRKVSLPVYPFQKIRYWLPVDGEQSVAEPISKDNLKPDKKEVNDETPSSTVFFDWTFDSENLAEGETPMESSSIEKATIFTKQLLATELNSGAHGLDMNEGFLGLGLTSHNLLKVAQRIKKDIHSGFLPSIFFECSSPLELAAYLNEQFEDRFDEMYLVEKYNQSSAKAHSVVKSDEALRNDQFVISANREDFYTPFPLTDIQESFLAGRKLSKGKGIGCHLYMELDIDGYDIYRLNQAWKKLVIHHGMLRARILANGQQQIVENLPEYSFNVLDYRRKNEVEQKNLFEAVRDRMSHKVYGIEDCPLYEITISIGAENKTLHLSIDEFIVDASSLQKLLQQWKALYNDLDWVIPPVEVTFRDYVLKVKDLEQSAEHAEDMGYWVDRLNNLPSGPSLPSRGKRGMTDDYERVRFEGVLESANWQTLKKKIEGAGISPTVFLLGVFMEVLRASSDTKSFSLILTFFNRMLDPRLKDLIGPFISTIVLVAEDRKDLSFEHSVKHMQRDLFEDLGHSSVSGIKVLRELKRKALVKNSIALNVVYTSLLGDKEWDNADSFYDLISFFITQTPQVYLDHQTYEQKGDLKYTWDVALEHFDEGVIEKLFNDYSQVLNLMAEQLDISDQAFELLVSNPKSEGEITLKHFPNEDQAYPLTDQQQAYAYGRIVKNPVSSQIYREFEIVDLDVHRLEAAWSKVLLEYPALRTVILPNGTQQINKEIFESIIEVVDLRGFSTEELELALQDKERTMISRVCPIGEFPNFELAVSALDDNTYKLHLCVDLIVVDLRSIDLVINALFSFYKNGNLEPVRSEYSYRDYILSMREFEITSAYGKSLNYWKNKFSDLPSGPELMTINKEASFSGTESVKGLIKNWDLIRQRAKKRSIPSSTVLLTVYAEILSAWSESPEFSIVVPSWERIEMTSSIEAIAGDFTAMSWLPVKKSKLSFSDKSKMYDGIIQEDLSHKRVSGLRALRREVLRCKKELKFPIVFTNLSKVDDLELPSDIRCCKTLSQTPDVLLDNISEEDGNSLRIHWDKAKDFFPDGMIEGMFNGYLSVLKALSEDEKLWDATDFSQWLDGTVGKREAFKSKFYFSSNGTVTI